MAMANVLFWVQNLLGSGHLGRAQIVSEALVASGFAVTLVNGGRTFPWHGPGVLQRIDLPSVSASDASFAELVDVEGRPVGAALWAERRRILLSLFDRLRPEVLITEMFPFGRRAFAQELLPLLGRAAAGGTLRVASVRDVLVRADPAKHRWMRDVALEHYDLLLAHTDPALIPFGLTFAHRDDLEGRLVETGFVAPRPTPPRTTAGLGEVIVSAGGGRVGRRLLEAALAARHRVRSPVCWRLIAADHAEAEVLQRCRPDGVIVDRQRADFRDLLGNSLLSVSQAGYNTVVEMLAYGKRMVLVPFEDAGENEQRTRAERLAARGLAHVLEEGGPTPEALAEAVELALSQSEHAWPRVDIDGARRSAELIGQRLGAGPAG